MNLIKDSLGVMHLVDSSQCMETISTVTVTQNGALYQLYRGLTHRVVLSLLGGSLMIIRGSTVVATYTQHYEATCKNQCCRSDLDINTTCYIQHCTSMTQPEPATTPLPNNHTSTTPPSAVIGITAGAVGGGVFVVGAVIVISIVIVVVVKKRHTRKWTPTVNQTGKNSSLTTCMFTKTGTCTRTGYLLNSEGCHSTLTPTCKHPKRTASM